MRHLDLFSGIGLFSYAMDRVWNCKHIFCEIHSKCRKLLKQYYPTSEIYEDIKELEGTKIGTVDFLTAGAPCQPASVAGKRLGTKDDR